MHDTGAFPARQDVFIEVGRDAFLAYTPDPLVLLPGAGCIGSTTIVIATQATAIVSESFAWHDLEEGRRAFDVIRQSLIVRDEQGRELLKEVGSLSGERFRDATSPLGPYRAVGTMLVLGPELLLPDPPGLRAAADEAECLAGVGSLPNGAGLLVRCLAAEGGTLRKGLDAVFRRAFRALVGIEPAPRPK